ncbi:hypothetical protein [Bacillus andreraoultii]|uniref:hypothetical protein n=1 Tax=Bacillus andreraoultii TaxID=1499685 RepID=UPI00053ADE3E|nr:hypothetical protein [Bacillus andreraoultii]
MKFGCHLSIKDGFLGAAKKAYKMKANAFQYFPKNPRSLSVKEFDKENATLCHAFCKEKAIYLRNTERRNTTWKGITDDVG